MTRTHSAWLVTLAMCTALACSRNPVRSMTSGYDAAITRDLRELRGATTLFQVLDSAVATGYAREVQNCLVHEHHGAMGYHHVNSRLMDEKPELRRPEILLYERMPDGTYRLNGVEFIVPYRSWARDSVAPVLMGQKLMQEDNLKFWYLHVWAWKQNPEGLFANFHPDVECPAAARKVFTPSQ
jgi:hypothetical protein